MSMEFPEKFGLCAFLVVLIALFAAALFRPERIRQRQRFLAAGAFLAVVLLLEGIGPFFFTVPDAVSRSMSKEVPLPPALVWSEVEQARQRSKILLLLQESALAAALFAALSAFFQEISVSEERYRSGSPFSQPPVKEHGPTPGADRPRSDEMPAKPKAVPEDTCLSCGQRIPPSATACPACGWTWDSEKADT